MLLLKPWRRILSPRCSLVAVALLFPFFFLMLLITGATTVEGFPFQKSSGVVELTPETFHSFLLSHKPVYILFYAPWCGHCRRIHPEWEKFAKAVQGTIRVGAVNADEHKQLSQQFDIRGFPTIRYWGVGRKNINEAKEYNGPREAGTIQARAMNDISSSNVKTIGKSEALRKAVLSAPEKKVVVLFSSKTRVPAIFSVLSHSPRLKSMPFYFLGGQTGNTFGEEFGVYALPSIAVLSSTDGVIETTVYPGKQMAYESIAKFLLSSLTGDAADKPGIETGHDNDTPAQEGKSKGKEIRGNDCGFAGSKLALPVRPVRLTAQLLADFCTPTTPRAGGGRPPLCVISLASQLELAKAHRLFRNEPLVFFEGHDDRDVLLSALRGDLSLGEVADDIMNNAAAGQVLLLRAPKRDTVRYKLIEGVTSVNALNGVLQKVLAGELQLGKKMVQ